MRGTARKRGILGAGQTRKKGGLRCGSGQKRGVFTAAHTYAEHICEYPPPPPPPPDHIIDRNHVDILFSNIHELITSFWHHFVVTYCKIGTLLNKMLKTHELITSFWHHFVVTYCKIGTLLNKMLKTHE